MTQEPKRTEIKPYGYIESISKLGSRRRPAFADKSVYILVFRDATFFGDIRFCLQYTEIWTSTHTRSALVGLDMHS